MWMIILILMNGYRPRESIDLKKYLSFNIKKLGILLKYFHSTEVRKVRKGIVNLSAEAYHRHITDLHKIGKVGWEPADSIMGTNHWLHNIEGETPKEHWWISKISWETNISCTRLETWKQSSEYSDTQNLRRKRTSLFQPQICWSRDL